MQAKVHDLKKFRVLTYTYQILSEFQLAVCSKYVRSMFAVCSKYVRSMFAVCSQYVRKTGPDEVCEARGVVGFCFGSSYVGLLCGSLAGWLAS